MLYVEIMKAAEIRLEDLSTNLRLLGRGALLDKTTEAKAKAFFEMRDCVDAMAYAIHRLRKREEERREEQERHFTPKAWRFDDMRGMLVECDPSEVPDEPEEQEDNLGETDDDDENAMEVSTDPYSPTEDPMTQGKRMIYGDFV